MFACIMTRATRAAPESYAQPKAMLEALTPYGQDDVQGHWANDHMLMVQALTWNTPESRHETTPQVCKDTGRVIVSWVRLDNRAELCAKLGLANAATLTDPQIILESHRKWGAECADALEGDFSFVIYDPATARTFCARDSLGVKPFFYYADDNVFIAASTAALFRHLKKLSLSPSQDWIARQLTSTPHVVTKSAYEDVFRLAPAHSLTVAREGAVAPVEYFQFKDMAPAADTRDPAHVEAYRAAFHKAVEARLRSDYLIGAENSGGLDSVSIMGHAVKHLPHDMDDFHCFGLPKQEKDQELILEASRHAQVRHTHLATYMKGRADIENFDRAVKTLGHPVEHSQINVHMSALRQSEEFGIRTMFSGYGGDEIVTNQASALHLELFRNGQFDTLKEEQRGNALTRRLRYYKRKRAMARGDTFSPKYFKILERQLSVTTVRRDVLEELGIIADQKAEIAYGAQTDTLNDRILRTLAFHRCRVGRLEACTVMGQSHRVEYRWPLYDRPLMQCYLRTPAIEKRHKLMGRYLHRRAVAGSIPDAITWQRTKDMGNMVWDAFSSELPAILDEASVSAHLAPLLDFDRIRKMQATLQDLNTGDHIDMVQKRAIWDLASVTRWLET